MIPPKPDIAATAAVDSIDAYRAEYQRSIDDPIRYWGEQAERLDWFHPPDETGYADYAAVDFRWYAGGKLNACFNCVDRHLATQADKNAIIWAADEAGHYEHITYRQLHRRVCRVANVLRTSGVRRGDRVCIYLPMIPELAYTMLACARIGAIHSIVFAGFSAEALRDRILDADCRIVVTANEGVRGGRTIPLLRTVDDAIRGLDRVDTVLVARSTDEGASDELVDGQRYRWLEQAVAAQRATCPAEWMDAEDPLFILYTSGSTGKPKGVMHSTGGYLVYTSLTHERVFDLKPDSVYACVADVGWITGHSYIIYGPLANGATTVMFESTPLYPDAGRYWRLVQDLGVDVFYTAPTAIRAIAREGNGWVERYDRSSLRVLGTVGEPINPDVWEWYHDVVGDGRCAVVDTWWQTETGGILIAPLPGATPTKPGSATLPLFGIEPVLMDAEGQEIAGNDVSGNLCIRRSWPGQARTIWGDHQRFVETYFSAYPGFYFTGDGCRRDEDGYYWITGRVDDVLNVSGHRLGTAEIESALVAHDAVAEAAVVGFPHDIKGQGIFAYGIVTPEAAAEADGELVGALKEQVRHAIGPIAKPDAIQIVPGLPKTRSGKIMRRILRKIASQDYDQLGDVSTLADPSVVEQIVEMRQARGDGA
ncbi:MAG: acetate--CoA ligase [Acidobacteriota bacterium]